MDRWICQCRNQNERVLPRSDLELRSLVPNMFDGVVGRVGGRVGVGGWVNGRMAVVEEATYLVLIFDDAILLLLKK